MQRSVCIALLFIKTISLHVLGSADFSGKERQVLRSHPKSLRALRVLGAAAEEGPGHIPADLLQGALHSETPSGKSINLNNPPQSAAAWPRSLSPEQRADSICVLTPH